MTQTFSALMRLNKMNKMMRAMERHQEMAARRDLTPEAMMEKMKGVLSGMLGVPVEDIKTSFDGPPPDDEPRGLPGFDLTSIMRGTKGH